MEQKKNPWYYGKLLGLQISPTTARSRPVAGPADNSILTRTLKISWQTGETFSSVYLIVLKVIAHLRKQDRYRSHTWPRCDKTKSVFFFLWARGGIEEKCESKPIFFSFPVFLVNEPRQS